MKTVLIVDDSEFMRSLIKKDISELDVSVIGEAANGKIAVEKYIELKPDIVTLDLAMHEHGGIEALEKIMQHDPGAKVIIVCSTAGQETVINDAKAMGAYEIVNKPLKHDGLKNAIKSLLDQ